MITQWEPILKDVISEVLETMFFALVEFEEGGAQPSIDYESRIRIYNHAGRIEISLRMNGEFARTITANMLGINEDRVEEDDLQDTLKELTNMVGGSYHARMKNNEWRLGIPEARQIVNGESGSEKSGLYFSSFGEPVGDVALAFVSDTGHGHRP